jgi:hypothetical protein
MNRNFNAVNRFKRQAGLSNIQIMIGVLISALLILGGVGLIKYIDKTKVNNDLSELATLKTETVNYGSRNGGSFAGFSQEIGIGLDFFPRSRVSGAVGSRIVQNQWKGIITAVPATINIANDGIVFTYTGVPSGACKDLAQQAGDVAATITVGGTVVKAVAQPPVLNTIITSCDAGADNVTIAYAMTK